MPDTNIKGEKSKLCRIIEENLPGATMVAGARKFFQQDLGMEYINQVRPDGRGSNSSLRLKRIWRVSK